MHIRCRLLIAVIMVLGSAAADHLHTHSHTSDQGRSTLWDNGISRSLKHIYSHCAESEDIFWCFKVQAAKLLGRALKVQHINLLEGVSIVKKDTENDTQTGRASALDMNLNNRDLDNLSLKSLDALIFERLMHFMNSRQLQLNLPRLLTFGQRNSQDIINKLYEHYMQFTSMLPKEEVGVDGRRKKGKKFFGPFIAVVLLKAAMLKMAYHSIAIVAGKALIVGKIALIISAIIGLKKLVSTDGGEKTTYEIVKHPQVQQSHTYSSSHAGEFESGHEGSSYHRSIDDEMMMQDKAYQAWVPAKVAT